MAIIDLRMSTIVEESNWLFPDNLDRSQNEDYEIGPIDINDISKGLSYQQWHLTWDSGTGNFIVTPAITGSPSIILNAADVAQCSFCFDQNGHVNIAYTTNAGVAWLYWYDSGGNPADWVNTELDAGVTSPTLTLDDKRSTQTQASDMLLWYTKDVGNSIYNCYHRMQRDRFEYEYEMLTNIPRYIYKTGMHDKLRVQIGFSHLWFYV